MTSSIPMAGFSTALVVFVVCYQLLPTPEPMTDTGDTTANGAAVAHPMFPDFGFQPPEDQYDGKLFHLRQDYPAAKPPDDRVPDFLKIPFDQNADGQAKWKNYLLAVRDYCFEGNI